MKRVLLRTENDSWNLVPILMEFETKFEFDMDKLLIIPTVDMLTSKVTYNFYLQVE